MTVSDELSESITKMQAGLASDAKAAAAPTPQPQKGGVLSGWFKNQTVRDAEAAESAYHGMLDHWKQVQRDLIGLQSDRHYYIDSFMDWVGENLSPSKADQDFAAIMTQYRHPVYVIERAQEDYNHALSERTRALLDDAATYSAVAGMLDRQDTAAFVGDMGKLFPRPDLPAAAEMRRLLLADFKVQGFADIALRHIQDPASRLQLLSAAIEHERGLSIDGKSNAKSVYPAILTEVCKDTAPLPVGALTACLRALASRDSSMDLYSIVLDNNTLTRLTERFGDDDASYTDALRAVIKGFGSGVNTRAVSHFVALRRAAINSDAAALASTMGAIPDADVAESVRGLWDIVMRGASNTGISLTQNIISSAKGDVKTCMPLLAQAINLGLARELVIENQGSAADAEAFKTASNVIAGLLTAKNIADVAPAAVTLVLAAARIGKNNDALQGWREKLTGKQGALRTVATATTIDAARKSEFIAALLSPIKSDFEKTALLEKSAVEMDGFGDSTAAGLLRDAARGIMGDAYPLDGGRMLVNPANIANMWFDGQGDAAGALLYTVGGKTQTLAQRITKSDAQHLMDILRHRHGFAAETLGLFNPALADGFEHSARGQTRIIWDMHEAPLNIDSATQNALLRDPAMIRARSSDARGNASDHSLRPAALLAMVPMGTPDQWLIIDRNGNHQIVTDITLPADTAPLLRMGNAYINPARASLISIDSASQTISLRVENPVFSQLMDAMGKQNDLSAYSADGQYLRVTATDKAQWQACMAAIDTNPLQLSPGGDLAHLRFNLDTLGFVTAYADAKSAGVQYSQKDKGGVSGRIEVDADIVPELMRGLSTAAAKAAGLLVVPANGRLSDMVVNLDHLHNVFYNPKDAALIMISDTTLLRANMDALQASRILKQLADLPKWDKVENRAASPDIMRLDRATVAYWDKDAQTANVALGNRAVGLGMTKSDFDQFCATARSAALQPVAGALTRAQLERFAYLCANQAVTSDNLPQPRRSVQPRDLFAKLASPAPARSNDDYDTEIYRKEKLYNQIMQKSNKSYSSKKYKY